MRPRRLCILILSLFASDAFLDRASAGDLARSRNPSAAERGRQALTQDGFLKADWSLEAYEKAAQFWDEPPPDPKHDPEGYAARFRERYGLHPAPFPNDGLPLGLRLGRGPKGTKKGLQIDCMVCHGGSIGGQSYVGLGNTQLDLKALLFDLTHAMGRRPPFSTFVINSARGTNNAGQIAAALLTLRNPDLSVRAFPLPLGANLPELDTPAWWHLKRKRTMYYDGRTDARSVRTNMQFLLGEKSLSQLQELEPTFRDVQAYILSLEPPKYPFPIDAAKRDRGLAIFTKHCVRCHGTYGPEGEYPNKIVPIDVIGTDPARLHGLSDRLVAHYNATWFGAEYSVDSVRTGYQAPPLDGVWATAPYLHNGSVPTLHALLDSRTRPARFTRPRSTSFEHYDTHHVGWSYRELTAAEVVDARKLSPFQAGFVVDTARPGTGREGHRFGDRLTEPERLDLIEYLKSL